jgi:antitoxin component of RelBE/YafQ-DinJ toxin-antitoxin module
MTEYTVLSTKVEKELAEKVQKYCQDNGLTPSSLLKALIEEELNKRKPLTAIYNEIASWQQTVNQAIMNLDYRTSKHEETMAKILGILDKLMDGLERLLAYMKNIDMRLTNIEKAEKGQKEGEP